MQKVKAFMLGPVVGLLVALALGHALAFGIGYAWGRVHMALEIESHAYD